jgi:hypothetical protein
MAGDVCGLEMPPIPNSFRQIGMRDPFVNAISPVGRQATLWLPFDMPKPFTAQK